MTTDRERRERAFAAFEFERERQVYAKGFTATVDDPYTAGQLADAAACYAGERGNVQIETLWPWDWKHWKPSPDNRKREIEKAVALLAAEWERLDRLQERRMNNDVN